MSHIALHLVDLLHHDFRSILIIHSFQTKFVVDYQLLDEVEKNIMICRWRAALFGGKLANQN